MREAIERVIASLEDSVKSCKESYALHHDDYYYGVIVANTETITVLKEVIANDASDSRIVTGDERDTQSQQQ